MQGGLMLGGVDESLLAGGMEPQARAKGEVVRFYLRPVKDEERSATEGRPVHVEREYVQIRVPGSRDEVDTPVTDRHRTTYALAYGRFKEGRSEQVIGTPLEQWPQISAPQVLDLQHFRIRTVEQLASVADSNLAALGPDGRALRERAKAWLELAQGAAPLSRLQAENDGLRHEVAALKQQVAELSKALERKRG